MRYNLDGEWMLATDPDNIGKEKRWFEKTPDGKKVRVPCTIQQYFPGYYGVAWYWRFFDADKTAERCLLNFSAVDYLAEVWVNGTFAGKHEGGETPFSLDITDLISDKNLLVVRVLNPTNEPIDGIVLKQTPHRNKVVPYFTGGSYNHGGIVQPVELIYLPSVKIVDIFSKADINTGIIHSEITIKNDNDTNISGIISTSVAPAISGYTIDIESQEINIAPGDNIITSDINIPQYHLWSLDDPYLYRVTVKLESEGRINERSVRCGFREFCFKDGYFHLNGRRIFLRSAHTGNHYPIGMQIPHDMELLRRDLYYAKTMGFNMVRFIAGMAWQLQLDFCDELGLMVYEESYAGWCMEDSPQMAERFDRSISEMILRDRNHPSITIWGLLNETPDGAVFRHAVGSLKLVRSLDDTRMVLLNSGRWDGKWSIGSISNPKSTEWEHLLGAEAPDAQDGKWGTGGYLENAGDAHYYPGIPLSADSIQFFRNLGKNTKHVFLSEHGNGGEVDAVRVVRLYEQVGASPDLEDYKLYKSEAEKFLADWECFGMSSIFADQSDFMIQSQRSQAQQRLIGLNAIRSNPNICGYSITGLCDQGMTAEGLWTTFRELKPEMMETIRNGWAPLRWCLFVEPVHGYKGKSFKLEAVLANEDVLLPGRYPIKIKIVGPQGYIFERSTMLNISGNEEFAIPVISEDIILDGPAGRYDVISSFEHGAAPMGGRTHFFVSDPASLPKVDNTITLWSSGDKLKSWLNDRGINYRDFHEPASDSREVILIGELDDVDKENFPELVKRIVQGGTAIFLAPQAFKKGDETLGWLPLANKGEYKWTQGWAAGRDDFAKAHPIFDGLPANGLMDLTYYRDIIPGNTFNGQDFPSELVAGAFAVGSYQPGGYYSGMHIAVYSLGAGSFIINSLLILDKLGKHPAADRLTINFIKYASRNSNLPLAELPANYKEILANIKF